MVWGIRYHMFFVCDTILAIFHVLSAVIGCGVITAIYSQNFSSFQVETAFLLNASAPFHPPLSPKQSQFYIMTL